MAATHALINLLHADLKQHAKLVDALKHEIKQLKEDIHGLEVKLWVQTHCPCRPIAPKHLEWLVGRQALEILELKAAIAELLNEKKQVYDRPDAVVL